MLILLSSIVAGAVLSISDPILGVWQGSCSFEHDTTNIAFEFTQDANGQIHAVLCHPVINIYHMEIPSPFVHQGDTYVNEGLAFSCSIKDGSLVGTFSGVSAKLDMKKAAALPVEPPIPDLPQGPPPAWTTNLGSPIYAPVTVWGQSAYVGTTGGVFHAINIADGSLAWTFSAGRGIFGAALATADAVYFVADSGFLYRLNRATGAEEWRYDLGDAQSPRVLPHPRVYEYDHAGPRPLLVDGVIYVGSGDGSFHAVDAAKGTRLWRFSTVDFPQNQSAPPTPPGEPAFQHKIRASAISAGASIIVPGWNNTLYALNPATGSALWTYDAKSPCTSTPCLADGHLIFGTRGSVLRSLDPATGLSEWRTLYWGSWVESEPVLYDHAIYIGASDLRRVSAYDPTNGKPLWRTDVFGCPWGTVAVTQEHVYAAAMGVSEYMMRHEGGLLSLNRHTGDIEWRIPAAKPDAKPDAKTGPYLTGYVAGPALADHALLIGDLNGTLASYPLPTP